MTPLATQIVTTVFFSFIAYLTIGLQLAVLPLVVSSRLGYGSLVAGLVISAQYLGTFLSRPHAGRIADRYGARRAVCLGLFSFGISGALTVLAFATPFTLPLLFVSRFFLGCGESCVGTGAILWGIGQIGVHNSARLISWNGVATYGAIAVGAPLGVLVDHHFGFTGIGIAIALLGFLSLPLALKKAATATEPGDPLPIRQVAGRVLKHGLGLGMGSLGFASIATFITLHYDHQGWHHAAWTLTAFSAMFMGIRLFLARSIDKHGGRKVATYCFVVEALGLVVLWLAPTVTVAVLGCLLTGAGFSLVFPSLAVEAMRQVSADNRGAALAIYSLFVDFSLAVIGPVGGLLAAHFGMASVFLFAACGAVVGLLLTLSLPRQGA